MNNKPVAELVLEQMAVGDASSLRVKWLIDGYPSVGTKLYTHPIKDPANEASSLIALTGQYKSMLAHPADLTDEEIWKCHDETDSDNWVIDFARAILRKAQEI